MLDFREKFIFFESGEVLELRLHREVDVSTLAVFWPRMDKALSSLMGGIPVHGMGGWDLDDL